MNFSAIKISNTSGLIIFQISYNLCTIFALDCKMKDKGIFFIREKFNFLIRTQSDYEFFRYQDEQHLKLIFLHVI